MTVGWQWGRVSYQHNKCTLLENDTKKVEFRGIPLEPQIISPIFWKPVIPQCCYFAIKSNNSQFVQLCTSNCKLLSLNPFHRGYMYVHMHTDVDLCAHWAGFWIYVLEAYESDVWCCLLVYRSPWLKRCEDTDCKTIMFQTLVNASVSQLSGVL